MRTVHINVKKASFPFGQAYYPDNTQPSMEERFPPEGEIRAMDMVNTLPTPAGFSSFFGTAQVGNLELPPTTEYAFTYKDSLGNNTLLAFGNYGAMYTTDGVNWVVTEVPTLANIPASTLVDVYKFNWDATVSHQSFVQVDLAVTTPGALATNLTAVTPATTGTTQDVTAVPTNAAGAYYNPTTATVAYDSIYDITRTVQPIDPRITTVAAGDVLRMTQLESNGVYTVLAGDTVATALQALVTSFNTNATTLGSPVFATYISNNRIDLGVNAVYGFLEHAAIYKEVAVTIGSGTLIGTLANDEVYLDIPLASQGNLGYLVFDSAGLGTLGSYNFRVDGYIQQGQIPGLNTSTAGGFTSADIDAVDASGLTPTPVLLPLQFTRYLLRQWQGVINTGLTVQVYDTGIPASITIGSQATVNNCYCNMVAADVVVGRVYTLVSKGQAGSYTAITGDTITTIVAGTVAAYNAAGAAVATQYGEQLIYSTSPEALYFQPASNGLAVVGAVYNTLTRSTVIPINANVASANFDQLVKLNFTVNVAPSNLVYSLCFQGVPVPILSTAGLWTDLNHEFTAAQLNAYVAGVDTLFTRTAGQKLELRVRPLAGAVYGSVTLTLNPLNTGGHLISRHVGPESSVVQYVADIANSFTFNQVTTQAGVLRYRQYPAIAVADPTATIAVSAYMPGGIDTTTLALPATPVTPTATSGSISVPVDSNGLFQGSLVNVTNPNSIATVAATIAGNPVTLAPGNSAGLTAAALAAAQINHPWFITIVRNRLYAFKQGLTYVLRLLEDGSAWEQLPTVFINVQQMVGICGARARLIAWDTAGSVYLSGVVNPVDFTPALSTGANVFKIDAVRGRIVTIVPFLDGFIVYSTASVIQAVYTGNTETFKYITLSSTEGILNAQAVTIADDALQYAYTDSGLKAVTAQGLVDISPEFNDYLKSSLISPRLDYIGNRYLNVSMIPDSQGLASSVTQTYTGATLPGLPSPVTITASPITIPSNVLANFSGSAQVSFYIPAPFTTGAMESRVDFYTKVSAALSPTITQGTPQPVPATLITGSQSLRDWLNTKVHSGFSISDIRTGSLGYFSPLQGGTPSKLLSGNALPVGVQTPIILTTNAPINLLPATIPTTLVTLTATKANLADILLLATWAHGEIMAMKTMLTTGWPIKVSSLDVTWENRNGTLYGVGVTVLKYDGIPTSDYFTFGN